MSPEEEGGIWLRRDKIEETIVTDGDSADIAIFVRIVFSIACNRRQQKTCVQILFMILLFSVDGD